MTWQSLTDDVLAEFAHFEHGVAFLTNSAGRELPYVAAKFAPDDCSPGQQWLEGDECERAAIVTTLAAAERRPAPRVVVLEMNRRLGNGRGTKPPLRGVELREVLRLAKRGLSAREIERRTGIGRNRITRALRGAQP